MSSPALTIAKFCILLIIGIVILTGVTNSSTASSTSSVVMTFTQNPSDGQTITLDSHVFEFDSGDGVVAGHILVTIGANAIETSANFKAAVLANTTYGVA